MYLYYLNYNDASVCYLCIGLAYQKIKEEFCKIKGKLGQREIRDLQYMNNLRNKLYNFKEAFNRPMEFLPLELEDEEMCLICTYLKYMPLDTYDVLKNDRSCDVKIDSKNTLKKFYIFKQK